MLNAIRSRNRTSKRIPSASLSIIIPAKNEASRIKATLLDLRSALPDAEICVVANNCSDRTVDVASEALNNDPLLRILDIPANTGKGGAIRVGMYATSRPYQAFVDADGSCDGNELLQVLQHLRNADCAIGSRWLPNSRILLPQTRLRRIVSRTFNLIVRVLFGFPFSDTQCGMKVFRREALLEILDNVESSDFSIDIDLLYHLRRCRKRIVEVPVSYKDDRKSTLCLRHAVPSMLLSILRLRLRNCWLGHFLSRLAPFHCIPARKTSTFLIFSHKHPCDSGTPPEVRAAFNLFESIASKHCKIIWFSGVSVDSARAPSERIEHVVSSSAFLQIAFLQYRLRCRETIDCLVGISASHAIACAAFLSMTSKVILSALQRFPSTKNDLYNVLHDAIFRNTPMFYINHKGAWTLGIGIDDGKHWKLVLDDKAGQQQVSWPIGRLRAKDGRVGKRGLTRLLTVERTQKSPLRIAGGE